MPQQNRSRDHAGAPELSATKARQAEPVGRLRYILAISLGLSVIGLIAVWTFGVF